MQLFQFPPSILFFKLYHLVLFSSVSNLRLLLTSALTHQLIAVLKVLILIPETALGVAQLAFNILQ